MTCIGGYTLRDIFILYTAMPPYKISLAITSADFPLMSLKLCNLQLCTIYHEKGLFTAVLLVFVA